MRTYGMSYQNLMGMPIRAFWGISNQVERIRADESKLMLQISCAAQSGDAAQELAERLEKEAPHPVELSGAAIAMATAVRDPDAGAQLRALAG